MANDRHPIGPPRATIVVGSGAQAIRALTGNLEPADVKDPVSAAPDLVGHVGRAWKQDLDAMRRKLGVRAEDDGALAIWIVEAPWAHLAWHSYVLVLVHLRPMPDGRATVFHLEGATHELWLYAANPDTPREPVIRGEATFNVLHPCNFAAQLIEASDEAALAKIEAAVRDVIDGRLSPDTDFRRTWADRFGWNMMKDRPHG